MAHKENHIYSSKNVKDIVIGLADGLTVPFALAAGLTGVIESNSLIVAAGAAEIAAGSIAMGLGGYLAAKAESDHYKSEFAREKEEIIDYPEVELKEVEAILKDFGVPKKEAPVVAKAISSNPKKWVDFMMKFELGLEKPASNRMLITPSLIAASYVLGGLIPLFPYMLTGNIAEALKYSCLLTVTSLAIFGSFKGYFTGISPVKSALHTTLIGTIAAAAAYFIGSLF